MYSIRPYEPQDWPLIWPVLQSVVSAGDTYAFAPNSTEAEMHDAWVAVPQATYVAATDSGSVVGSYILKPNHSGLGGHVCNCGYIVAEAARDRGVASALCEHSQVLARALGYRAMQFNLVVSTNAAAVHLWQKLGFAIVGTLPAAFNHSRLGYVDAYVMHKHLVAT